MDPDANIEEQIRLLEQGQDKGWDGETACRYVELSQAYSEWRSNGGFAARQELLDRKDELVDKQFGTGGISGAELASRQMSGVNPYASSWNWKL